MPNFCSVTTSACLLSLGLWLNSLWLSRSTAAIAQPIAAEPVSSQTYSIWQPPLPLAEFMVSQAANQQEPADSSSPASTSPVDAFDLDPDIYENSPVLQEWLADPPDIADEIRHDPSFRTRLKFGCVQFPSTNQASGFNLGIEDVFIGRTGLTVSADYQAAFDRDRTSYGADLHYFVRPLGRYINVAPLVGYRYLETDDYTEEGLNVGIRLMLALSRTGAADISLSQSWVDVGTSQEVGLTSISVGYALTQHLRLSADIQKQNSTHGRDSMVGIGLEWLL
ncbi:MAG: hypothetical protein ACTS2F_01825 [Thainema sp.]